MAKKTNKADGPAPTRAEAPPGPEALAFDEIFGQGRAIGVLRGVMTSRRIHHAWIFHGPRGVGKFTTAVAFASSLLAPAGERAGGPPPASAGETGRMIRAGTHPDLHVVTKELAAISREAEVRGRKQMTIPKGVIDEFLVEPASRTRSMGGDCLAGKVFIVDEAELLDPRTQNSLLKVMEEPAPGSVIILVTSQEERLLPTIRSRCQRVAFGPLDDAAMRAWLDSKGLGEGERARAWLLQTSNGSPGAALAAVENGLYEWHETLAPMLRDLDTARFPADLGAALVRFVDERAADWVKRNRDASKDAANKAWAARVLAFLAEHERRTLRDGVAGGAEERRVRRHLAAIELIAQAESQIHANVNLGLAMENLVAQMAREAV